MQNYERVKSDPVSAELYTKRKPRKHQFEMQMVSEAFQMLPSAEVKAVLDAPCGVGRLRRGSRFPPWIWASLL